MHNEADWRNAYSHESSDGFGFRVQMIVPGGRELSNAERAIVSNYASKAIDDLRSQMAVDAPDGAAERRQTIEELLACFPDTARVYVGVLANQYGKGEHYINSPWLRVTTTKGPIVLGWRKRVIHIDWGESDIKAEATALFPCENTTKGEHSIHAWTLDAAQRYLRVILEQPAAPKGMPWLAESRPSPTGICGSQYDSYERR